MKLLSMLTCYWRGCHDPQRYPLGGFLCGSCGFTGESLHEMGFLEGGYVSPVRKTFDRKDGGVSRTSAWEPGPRGW